MRPFFGERTIPELPACSCNSTLREGAAQQTDRYAKPTHVSFNQQFIQQNKAFPDGKQCTPPCRPNPGPYLYPRRIIAHYWQRDAAH